MLDSTKFTKAKAIETYQHTIKFCTTEDIYSALEREDPNVLFLTYILNQSFDIWMYAIVDGNTMDILAMQSPGRVHFGIGKQFATSNIKAEQSAGMYGGTPAMYKNKLFMIWQSRAKLALNSRDFSVLGRKLTVNVNYAH